MNAGTCGCNRRCANTQLTGENFNHLVGGIVRKLTLQDVLDRIEEHSVRIPECGCRIWTRSIESQGYGTIQWCGRVRKLHRLVWELVYGPIPSGMCVLHRCDVRCCISIHHLFLGTHQDNMSDMMAKGRNVPNRGSKNGLAKLTEEQARSVREDQRSHKQIAAEYGISTAHVSNVKRRKTWRHV